MNRFPPRELYEVIDCAVWTLGLGVLAIIAYYLAAAWRKFGFRNLIRLRDQVAMALFVYVFGAVAFRFWTWLGIHLERTGHDVAWMVQQPPWALIPVAASVLQVLGLLRLTCALAPGEWGRYGWVPCVAFSIAATVLLTAF